MNTFTDYYTLLGVETDATSSVIKAAFKKLALQYHPDVYKGADAHERMRVILLAYKTLNDPVARKQYDAEHSVHSYDGHRMYTTYAAATSGRSAAGDRSQAVVSPGARRDRQRHYAFPDFPPDRSVHIDLVNIDYTLSAAQGRTLVQQGLLRGVKSEIEERKYYCHRCHHHWQVSSAQERETFPRYCPQCLATDWPEYLLLRCIHCRAVFESEQIRYEVGSHSYGSERSTDLCPPYELFPLCPYCGTARWSPAEDKRVSNLRQRAATRATLLRAVLTGMIIVVVVLIGTMLLSGLH